MARTLKSDSPSGLLHFGNGSSVINPAFPLLDMGKFSRTSDFTINSPNVKIDPDLKKIVIRETERLRFKTFKYTGDESDWTLEKILKSADGTKDKAKAKLTRDGRSAVISEVSKAINASSIDHASKYLLSNEPLYVYALSYAIYHEGVDDAEGINDRIVVATENKIKTYFNKLLAKKFIRDRHIDLSKEQKKQIMKAAGSTHMSYSPGGPSKAINKIISKYVDYGDLNMLVDKFFESGRIDPEKGTPQVRQLMVKYLIDIGLIVPKSALASSASGASGASGSPGSSGSSGASGSSAASGSSGSSAPMGASGFSSWPVTSASEKKDEKRTTPAEGRKREGEADGSGASAGNPTPKDPASDIAKKMSEMDITTRKEGSPASGSSSESSKSSSKSAK